MKAGRRVLYAGALILGTVHAHPAAAQPSPICQILGPAARYSVVAKEKLETTVYHRDLGTLFIPAPTLGGVCSVQIKVGRLTNFFGDVVAVSAADPAISFGVMQEKFPCRRPYGYSCYDYYCGYAGYGEPSNYPCCSVEVWEELVATGGGSATAFRDHFPFLPYGVTIDTSGANPQVAECASALTHVVTASTALNQGLLPGEPPSAARPVVDLGDLVIDTDEEHYLEGGDTEPKFYRVRNLVIKGGRLIHYGGYEYQEYGGSLAMYNVVLNVTGRVRIGRGVHINGEGSVINVLDRGGGIKLQRETLLEGVALLAPDRNIRVKAQGGGLEYYWVRGGNIVGKRIKMTGTGAFFSYYGIGPVDCGLEEE